MRRDDAEHDLAWASDAHPRTDALIDGHIVGVRGPLPSYRDGDDRNDGELARSVQLVHPDKILALSNLPGLASFGVHERAALFDLDPETYLAACDHYRARAQVAARDLLLQPTVANALSHLPLREDDVLVTLGDSITDDYQSWAEILRHLLAESEATRTVRVVNSGISGDTTTRLIERAVTVIRERPAWVLILIGTNDVQRQGGASGKPLVSLDETGRNLQELRRLLLTRPETRIGWLTPPPVIEDWLRHDPMNRDPHIISFNRDIAEVVRVVREQPDPVLDLSTVFCASTLERFLLPDGIHPSLSGHQAIALAVVQWLAQVPA